MKRASIRPRCLVIGGALVASFLLPLTASADPLRTSLALEQRVEPPTTKGVWAERELEAAKASASPGDSATLLASPELYPSQTHRTEGKPRDASNQGKPPLRASVGEGGRDIVPRFRLESDAAYRPYVAIELHGGAGAEPSLLREGSSYFRGQPVAAAGLSPVPHVTVYAGLGPGASLVVPDGSAAALDLPDESVALTGAVLLGARWETQAFPMVVEARADAVSDHGIAATVMFAVELAN